MALCSAEHALKSITSKGLSKKVSVIPNEILFERIREGDRNAFGELACKYLNLIYATALAIIPESEEIDDICQESLFKAYDKFHTLKDPRKFSEWLRIIVRREAYSHLRKKKRFVDYVQAFLHQKNSDEHIINSSKEKHLYHQQLFQYAIQPLSKKAREIVLMHYMGGMSCEEISEQIGIRIGTVKSHLFKARDRMLKSLEKYGIHDLSDL